MIWGAYAALDAVESNKVYLYLLRLESPVKAELSHWCNNLTRAGPGCQDSHQTDKDVHKRIYIGCHGGIDSYRPHIDATSMHTHSNTQIEMERLTSHTHTLVQAKFLSHSSSLFMLPNRLIWVISPADSGSDSRYWMTRGNHIEARYDQIQGRPLMPCTKTQLDHVLTHNTGSLLIQSLLQLTFPLKHNITQLPASCFRQKQLVTLCVWVCVFVSWYFR